MLRAAIVTVFVLGISACGGTTPAPKPPTPIVAKSTSARAPQVAPPINHAAASSVPPKAANAAGMISTATSANLIVEIAGVEMPKPVSWTWEAPTMQFRALQYAVPAPAGASGAAELIFSVFAAGDGGPIDANVKRWESQFRTEDGAFATALTEDHLFGGIKVKLVHLSGGYQGMGQAAPRPGYEQRAAIIQLEGTTIYARLVGPKATVGSARIDFMTMIEGVRLAPK